VPSNAELNDVTSGQSKRLGNALEDIVASLHDLPGVEVATRVFLPVVGSDTGRTREIDVLLSSEVAGYPVRIAIGCKNEKEPLGVPDVDGFVGQLEEVGIPRTHGVLVSALGYTKDALESAIRAGIRPLRLEGLDSTRLAGVINDAIQSIVYLVAGIRDYNVFVDHPDVMLPPDELSHRVSARHGTGLSGVNNYIWEQWVTGRLPVEPGEQTLFVGLPRGYEMQSQRPIPHEGLVIVTLVVTAHVGHIPGTAVRFQLRNESSGAVEKARLNATFQPPAGPLELQTIATVEELEAYRRSVTAQEVVAHRLQVPRIVTKAVFWPPSAQAIRRIQVLREAGEPITFATVEGTDLSKAWEGFAGHDERQGHGEQTDRGHGNTLE
jgi:restriction endonuclease